MKNNMWKNNKGNWEYVAIDEPEGQVVVKFEKESEEKVLIDEPEGQVVLKKAKKIRKKESSMI